MKTYVQRKTNALLWVIISIFTAEVFGIVGYYWLAGGHFGDASLTISKFVGLNLWSSIVFGLGNTFITILMLYYLSTHARITNTLWHLLMIGFVGCFIILSIFPHLPDGSMVAQIHQLFAAVMFCLMALVGILSLALSKQKTTTILSTLFVTFSIYFILSYIFKPDYFVQNILWLESAYLYSFFVILISSNNKQLD